MDIGYRFVAYKSGWKGSTGTYQRVVKARSQKASYVAFVAAVVILSFSAVASAGCSGLDSFNASQEGFKMNAPDDRIGSRQNNTYLEECAGKCNEKRECKSFQTRNCTRTFCPQCELMFIESSALKANIDSNVGWTVYDKKPKCITPTSSATTSSIEIETTSITTQTSSFSSATAKMSTSDLFTTLASAVRPRVLEDSEHVSTSSADATIAASITGGIFSVAMVIMLLRRARKPGINIKVRGHKHNNEGITTSATLRRNSFYGGEGYLGIGDMPTNENQMTLVARPLYGEPEPKGMYYSPIATLADGLTETNTEVDNGLYGTTVSMENGSPFDLVYEQGVHTDARTTLEPVNNFTVPISSTEMMTQKFGMEQRLSAFDDGCDNDTNHCCTNEISDLTRNQEVVYSPNTMQENQEHQPSGAHYIDSSVVASRKKSLSALLTENSSLSETPLQGPQPQGIAKTYAEIEFHGFDSPPKTNESHEYRKLSSESVCILRLRLLRQLIYRF